MLEGMTDLLIVIAIAVWTLAGSLAAWRAGACCARRVRRWLDIDETEPK